MVQVLVQPRQKRLLLKLLIEQISWTKCVFLGFFFFCVCVFFLLLYVLYLFLFIKKKKVIWTKDIQFLE